MRKLYLDQLQPGMVLARTVYNGRGDVLLGRDVDLSPAYIEALRAQGFYAIYVLDGVSDEVQPQEVLSEELHIAVYKHLLELFTAIQNTSNAYSREGKDVVLARLVTAAAPHAAHLNQDAQKIVVAAGNAEFLSGVSGLKSRENYILEHPIEVAVAAVMLGKRLGLPPTDLQGLALGCLCHDLGELAVPPEVLAKSGNLSQEEFALVQRHPQTGYETVQQFLGASNIIARHVVFQHHERQDGTGYPRHLRGNNRFGGMVRQRFGQGLILPAAEIAAVADVYSALSSDRPYRRALAPSQVADYLRNLSDDHLNRELVKSFLTVLPTYPVGTPVTVNSGQFQSHRGVVVALHLNDLHRPTVRIVEGADGQRIPPFEIDASMEREIELASC